MVDAMDTRICRDCGLTKPIDDFPVRRKDRGKVETSSRCRSCKAAYRRRYYQTGPGKAVAQRSNAKARAKAKARGVSRERSRYIDYVLRQVDTISKRIAKAEVWAEQLEYRAEFPIYPRLDVRRWDETHDVWHRGERFLVDHVVVERLVRGRPPGEAGYNRAERDMAILRLNMIGLQDSRIAQRLGMLKDSVQNIRQTRLGVEPPPGDPQDQYRERDFW